MSDEEDRLARWSRRKIEGDGPPPDAAAAEPEPLGEAALAALPDVATIDATTDIRGFLQNGVPQALRAAALARAWLTDPAIRDRVPDAIDYAEDYNAPHTISGWGPACPDEARRAVARAHPPEPHYEAPEPARPAIETQGETTAQEQAPRHDDGGAEAAPAPVVAALAREGDTKMLRRHGGALPEDD